MWVPFHERETNKQIPQTLGVRNRKRERNMGNDKRTDERRAASHETGTMGRRVNQMKMLLIRTEYKYTLFAFLSNENSLNSKENNLLSTMIETETGGV